MLLARGLIVLAVVPVMLLGCTSDPQPPAATATPAATETPAQLPTATPLGHPEPLGETSRYLLAMTQLGFACDAVDAMECRRMEGSVEYSVDIGFTPDGWVSDLDVYARAQDPVSDLRTQANTVAAHMAAIARPLLDGPAELADVQGFLGEHLAAYGNGDQWELGRIVASVGSWDPHVREGGEVSAHLDFTDVVVSESP